MTFRALPYVSLIFRVVVGSVLIYAGFLKAIAPSAEFAAALEAYKIFPTALLKPIALLLPWFELWVGTFLIFGYSLRISAALAAGLFAAFLAVLASALIRKIDLTSCGCFGTHTMLSPSQTIIADILLLGLCLFLLWSSTVPLRYSLDSWLDKTA